MGEEAVAPPRGGSRKTQNRKRILNNQIFILMCLFCRERLGSAGRRRPAPPAEVSLISPPPFHLEVLLWPQTTNEISTNVCLHEEPKVSFRSSFCTVFCCSLLTNQEFSDPVLDRPSDRLHRSPPFVFKENLSILNIYQSLVLMQRSFLCTDAALGLLLCNIRRLSSEVLEGSAVRLKCLHFVL